MSNVDELVEEVARAIMPSAFSGAGATLPHSEILRKGARSQAKAAIKAVLTGLKAPSLEMIKAGLSELPRDFNVSTWHKANAAAYDALLAELEDK